MQNAKDNQNIHPATESLVVALTDLCSRDNSNRLKIVIAIPICSHKLENIFERVLKCIVNTVPRINQSSAVISLATDGDTNAKYHKSSLVNSILNSSTKILSSDRNVRSINL